MKAKIKASGLEIDAFFDEEKSFKCGAPCWGAWIEYEHPKRGMKAGLEYYHERELEFIEEDKYNIDWQKVRIQASIAIMQANYTNPDLMQFLTTKEDFPFAELARISVKSADILIEELKKTM